MTTAATSDHITNHSPNRTGWASVRGLPSVIPRSPAGLATRNLPVASRVTVGIPVCRGLSAQPPPPSRTPPTRRPPAPQGAPRTPPETRPPRAPPGGTRETPQDPAPRGSPRTAPTGTAWSTATPQSTTASSGTWSHLICQTSSVRLSAPWTPVPDVPMEDRRPITVGEWYLPYAQPAKLASIAKPSADVLGSAREWEQTVAPGNRRHLQGTSGRFREHGIAL